MVIVVVMVALAIGLFVPDLLGLAPLAGMEGMYLAVACLAGLDSLCGGLRSVMEGKFHTDVFVTGFIANIVIAFFLAWLGDQIGVNLFLAAVLVMGSRIYTNLSLMRRFGLTRIQDARARKALQEQQAQTNA